ncbi:MAG TPA: hypothetical protein EYP10_03075, partial [Armatimonadetes bacterium]|nr:hypothetical protein [Armatimonadota bacterium]
MRRILEHLKKHPCIVELMDTLHCGARVVQVEGVRSSGWGVCAATLADISNRTSVLIAPSREHAERIYEDIRLYWSPAGATPDSHPRLYRFPVQTEAFIGYGGEGVTARERIAALLAIHQRSDAVIVTSIEAIARPTVSPDAFEHCCFDLRCGDVIPIDALTGRLIAGGYETSTEVQLPGEFSRRGGIVDVFSPSCDLPVRIEFFGDEIESMRLFDPATQRSVETIERCTITPAREFIIPSDHKRLVEAVHTALANQADQLRANGKVEAAR